MKLTILFGGASFEHEISIVSAITLKEKLSHFDLTFVFCTPQHDFYLIDPRKMHATTFSSYEYKKMPLLSLSKEGFSYKKLLGSVTFNHTVLNLIHGGDGEDGVIAGLLDFYKIDYIGPRKEASVFSFSKLYTKYLAQARDVKVLDFEVLYKNEVKNIQTPFPLIIKPATLGSSIGVSIVKEESELDYALDVAFEFDEVVIVEPFIANVKEYNLAGYFAKGELHFSIVEEPHKEEFLDFEKKYMDFSRSSAVAKADISEVLEQKLQANFQKLYVNLFEGALIRCDFFVIENEVYINEINAIPGSMANYLFEDFSGAIESLATSLPKGKKIEINYEYIHSISSAKGK